MSESSALLTAGGGDKAWDGPQPPMPAIGGFQPLSLQDFPGKPAAIIFTRGCNLRCAYCHNADLIGPGESLSHDLIWGYLTKRRKQLRGVVITGGEPTIHPELPLFIGHLRELGYHIKLDTNGLRPGVIERLVADRLIDHLSVDWKAAPRRYEQFGTPYPAPWVLDALQRCGRTARRAGITLEWRTTVAEPLISLEDLWVIGSYIQPGDQWSLQQYQCRVSSEKSESTLDELRPFSAADLHDISEDFSELSVVIR